MSGWVATAGGLWDLRLNAPSKWFLASHPRMTICKTKIQRRSLRSPEDVGIGFVAFSVMATELEQTACQLRGGEGELGKRAGKWELSGDSAVFWSRFFPPIATKRLPQMRHFVRQMVFPPRNAS